MFSLFATEQVTVIRTGKSYDELGEPIKGEDEREQVDVLVCPGATADLDVTRPNGAMVAYTLHFPKSYTKSLKDCRIEVRGNTYSVIGDPQPYSAANTPGEWNLTVEVEKVDG